MDIRKYQKIFSQESEKYLKELDDLLMAVEKDLFNTGLWGDIHGKVHSVKGMASALNLERITVLGHNMEEWCKKFQSGTVKAYPDAVQSLFNGVELLRLLVARSGEIDSAEDQRWYTHLMSQLKKGPEELAAGGIQAKPTPMKEASIGKIDYVRVKYDLIEELLGLSQEIMLLEKSLPLLSHEQISGGLKTWIDDYTSMLKGLHFRLAQLRLMSVGDFADLFVKTIRNLAQENGRKVRFEVIGGEIQADITLLERLREPFIHLIRNSIAHGIEPPEERTRSGKDPEGKITLEAMRERERLIIKIGDDGRGIDRSAVAKYFREKRSMTDDQISRISEEEFFDAIISPEFTSASETTDMSGRGIGMNVVAQAIEFLGGRLTIRSESLKGTEFIMRLPVSLSIIHTVTFKVGEYLLSIPTSDVESIQRREARSSEDEPCYDLRGLLGVKENQERSPYILRFKLAGEKYTKEEMETEIAVAVDSVIGNKRMMVMPIGEILSKAKVFSGVGIMENGDVSILFDIKNLPTLPNNSR
ncbi:MAG: ATP-binding protein [Pseudomonadota bacterium]